MTRLRPVALVALTVLMACPIDTNLGSLSTVGPDLSPSGTGDATDTTGSTDAPGPTSSTETTGIATDPTAGDQTTSTGLCPQVSPVHSGASLR